MAVNHLGLEEHNREGRQVSWGLAGDCDKNKRISYSSDLGPAAEKKGYYLFSFIFPPHRGEARYEWLENLGALE